MRFLALFVVFCFALLMTTASGEDDSPVQFSNNNIKNIITVGLDANLVASKQEDQTIVNILLALLNSQAAVVATADQNDA